MNHVVEQKATADKGDQRTDLAASRPAETGLPPMSRKETNPDSDRDYRLEVAKYWIEVVTLLALIVYAGLTWGLLKTARKTEKDAVVALRITEQDANAAKRNVDTAVAAERAWIVPTSGPQMNPTTVELYWRNVGKTPAVNLRGTAEYITDWPKHAVGTGCSAIKTDWANTQSLLLPGDATFKLALGGMPKDWSQVSASQQIRSTLIHGCIWYSDVLTNVQRTTEFCYDAQVTLWRSKPHVILIPCLTTEDPFVFR